ncbi:hypothetical protein BCR42DRAFT_463975 [Absidia repens]|uniref:G-protein coupled receptors family 2 profile 2 domain-containing protein n=1 Tax=Absidia repens TaxID=90262 RepID=A0A1X2J0K3_9FUNG|nr:hypothetical protein BCR42DRAFT_463975 [Absidia repens]
MASMDANLSPADAYFSSEEFYRLQKARLATALISLSFDFIAISVFIYLVIYYRAQVNRPSIRLAVFCCLANFLESVLFVVMIKVEGPSLFCLGFSLTSQYLAVLGVTLLAIIGINLVLVYVVNVRRRHILEYYYYPLSILYSAFGIIGPILQHFINKKRNLFHAHETCWYISVIKSRFVQPLNFMWFYCCIFFVTMVAFLCSTIAIIKLMKDFRTIQNLFKSRRQVVSKQVPVYSQVVVRCLLYPIVPLISNFCGFLEQCIIITGNYPPYSLNLASSICHGLSGFLVALIFLNDPVITQIFSGWYDHYFCKHVIEYSVIETNQDHYIRIIDETGASSNTGEDRATVLVSFPPCKGYLKFKSRFRLKSECRCTAPPYCIGGNIRKQHRSRNRLHNNQCNNNDNRDNIILGVDCPDAVEPAIIKNETANTIYKIPVRRLKLSSTAVNQYIDKRHFTPHISLKRSFSRNITVEESINGYSIIIGDDDESANYLLIPYPSVYYAKFIRWLLNSSIGRALHRSSNALIDVAIIGEPLQHIQHLHRRSQSISSDIYNPIS